MLSSGGIPLVYADCAGTINKPTTWSWSRTPEAGLVVLGAVVLLKVVWRGKTSAATPKVPTAASAKASREEPLVMVS